MKANGFGMTVNELRMKVSIHVKGQKGRYTVGMAGSVELENPATTGPQGRRTERIVLEIPIRVVSYGGSAGNFSEETRTLLVNRDGALISLQHRLVPDEFIRITNLSNLREADFRVVGLARQESGEITQWGVECLDKGRCLWDIDFPPPMEVTDAKGEALLQCQGCGKQCLLVLSLTEVDILDSTGAIEKLCENCGHLSCWVFVEDIGPPQKLAPPTEIPPAPKALGSEAPTGTGPTAGSIPVAKTVERVEKPDRPSLQERSPALHPEVQASPQATKWDGKTERRLHKRLTLKLPVMIRTQKGEIELGRTENISKGGLSVTLSLILDLSEQAYLVCPYSGSGNEIEQKAEVRRRVRLYGGQRWLYGFRYLLH